MKQTNISLPNNLYELVRKQSYYLCISQSEVVRRALYQYFKTDIRRVTNEKHTEKNCTLES